MTTELKMRAGFEVATSLPQPPDPRPAAWAAKASRYPEVQEALRYFSRTPTPTSLYGVYEVVRKDMSGASEPSKTPIVNKKWATGPEIDRFTSSVHSKAVFGDEARHAVPDVRYPPPTIPMLLPEATAFISGLLEKWIDSKP